MTRRIIDLTYPIHEGMTTYPSPNHPRVEISILGRHGIENRETRKIVLGTHTGTHCDAPLHMLPGTQTVDQLALEDLIGPAFVLDFSYCKPFQEVGIADFEKQLGDRKPERLIMRFDWSEHWGKMMYFTDMPYISQEAAQWLADRGLRLLGMDTCMPDNPKHGQGNDPDSPVHKILMRKGIILVEYLCNVKEIKKQEVELIVAPLKIVGGDGSPVRCIAIEND